LVLDLEPRELEDFGLNAAVRVFCEAPAVVCGWNLHIDAPEPDLRAPRPVERACFRVLQEGLNNVVYHAKASEVWIDLHHGADKLELVLRDNGIGFDRDAVREDNGREEASLGLFAMQMRAKQVGGSVAIKSVPGGGTEIRAVFPLMAAPVGPI
jgi:signal transduction histidine kinase